MENIISKGTRFTPEMSSIDANEVSVKGFEIPLAARLYPCLSLGRNRLEFLGSCVFGFHGSGVFMRDISMNSAED